MPLPFGISRLSILMLWSCICCVQKGYNIVHGYPLGEDDSISEGWVYAPLQQLYTEVSSNDPMQGSPYNPREKFNAEPVVRKPAYGSTSHHVQRPLHGSMQRRKTNEEAMGIRFPTVRDFKQFVESMKSTFLRPESSVKAHFQTARDMIENERLLNTQQASTEFQAGGGPYSSEENPGQNEVLPGGGPYSSEENPDQNEVLPEQYWNEVEPVNMVSEETEWAIDYMPSESLSVENPTISTQSVISTTSDYDTQQLVGRGPVTDPGPHLARKEYAPSYYASKPFGRMSVTYPRPIVYTSVSSAQDPFSGHVNKYPVNTLSAFAGSSRPSESSLKLVSESNIQQPNYTSPSSSQSKQMAQRTESSTNQTGYITSAQKPSSSYSENHRPNWIYIKPHSNLSIPMPRGIYQPPLGKGGMSSGFDSSTGQASPQSSSGYVSFQNPPISSANALTVPKIDKYNEVAILNPRNDESHLLNNNLAYRHVTDLADYQKKVSSIKQPAKAHVGNVKQTTNYFGQRGQDGDKIIHPVHPSITTSQEMGQQKPDTSLHKRITISQEPKFMTNEIGIHKPFRSNMLPNALQSGIPSGVSRQNEVGSQESSGFENVASMNPIPAANLFLPVPAKSHGKMPPSMLQNQASIMPSPKLPVQDGAHHRSDKSSSQRLNSPNDPYMPNYVVQSRGNYARGKVSFSQTRYSKLPLSTKDKWKPAQRSS